mgnify:CR=1 FL=1
MGLVTAIAGRPRLRAAVSHIGAGYIRLVRATGRWQVDNIEIPQAFWDNNKPFIGAFWHARLLMMPTNWRRDVKMNMLIAARGADTELIRRLGDWATGRVQQPSKGLGRVRRWRMSRLVC